MAAAPAGSPQQLNADGLQALGAGDAPRAASLFAAAADLDPGALALWLNLAKAQRLSGDDAGERDSLGRALALDQHDLTARIRLAELHERRGERAQANAAWSAVVQIAPPAEQRSPALAAVIDHAGAFIVAFGAEFARAMAAAVDPSLAVLSASARRRFTAALDTALGKRRIYTNECAGLHFPFLPADEFFAREQFPWLTALEAHTAAIRGELEALLATGDAAIQPYVDMLPGAPPNKWTPLDRSPDWSAYYLWKFGARIPAAAVRCPATAAALDAVPLAVLPGRAPNAFFSVLRPRTRIPPHTGVSNTRAIIHLPLIVPPGCGFRVGGETRAWVEGEAFAFDDTIEHEAWNDSDQLRAVLILDVWNPWLTDTEQRLLQEFYAAADASGLNPERPAA